MTLACVELDSYGADQALRNQAAMRYLLVSIVLLLLPLTNSADTLPRLEVDTEPALIYLVRILAIRRLDPIKKK